MTLTLGSSGAPLAVPCSVRAIQWAMRIASVALASQLACPLPAVAQTQVDGSTVQMDPFDVRSTRTNGYMATNTISGTAMNMRLIDVPMTINVITSEFLDDVSAGNVQDAFRYNSSITQTNRPTVDNEGPIISIRGFSNRNILLDGVPAGNFLPSYLIDRIEVVKGPNTMYGQSDPGGLVNVVSKRPFDSNAASLQFKFGSFDHQQVDLDVNAAAVARDLRVRILSSYSYDKGWRHLDGIDSAFAAFLADYKLTPTTMLRFMFSGNKDHGVPNSRSNIPFIQKPTDLNGDGLIKDTVGGVDEATARYNGVFVPWNYSSLTKQDSFEQRGTYGQFALQQRVGTSVDAQYLFTRSSESVVDNFRAFNTFTPARVADALYQIDSIKNSTDAHSLNVLFRTMTGSLTQNVLAGVRYTDAVGNPISFRLRPNVAAERTVLDRLAARTGPFRYQLTVDDVIKETPIWLENGTTQSDLLSQGALVSTTGATVTDTTTYYVTDSAALFNERLHLLGGIRRIEIAQTGYFVSGAVQNPRQTFSNTSYQAGVVYRMTKHLFPFGDTATSYNPNGINSTTGQRFNPEESQAFEVGLKFEGLWGNRINGSIAAFQIDKKNVVRSDYNPFTGGQITEVSDDQSRGVDVELFINPVPNWQLMINYSHLNAKTVKSQTAALGLPLEGAAPDRLSIWTSYEFVAGPLAHFRFGGGLISVNGPVQQFGTSSNRLIQQGSYSQVALFARYETKLFDRQTSFGVNVSNLTDKFFFQARALPNTPRAIIGTMRVKF